MKTSNPHAAHKQSGFTLVEVLIALFISAIVLAIASKGLYSVTQSQRKLTQRQQQLIQLQQTYVVLQNDIKHITHVPVKSKLGYNVTGLVNSFCFSRSSQSILNNKAYLTPMVICYNIVKDKLIRIVHVKAAGQTKRKTVRQTLLRDIQKLYFGYYHDGRLQPFWHYSGDKPFHAVVTLGFKDPKIGRVNWLFAVPGTQFNIHYKNKEHKHDKD